MKVLTKILNILKFVVTVVKAIAGFDKDKPVELDSPKKEDDNLKVD